MFEPLRRYFRKMFTAPEGAGFCGRPCAEIWAIEPSTHALNASAYTPVLQAHGEKDGLLQVRHPRGRQPGWFDSIQSDTQHAQAHEKTKNKKQKKET